MREKTSANRGFRSGSAPTPTPPPSKQTNGGSGTNTYYIRRPTVIFNDERGGPSDKSSGAQSRVHNKFVSFICYAYPRNIHVEAYFFPFNLDINSSTNFSSR